MRLRFGMMTSTLLDLAAIASLRPHGVVYSAADLPEPLLKPDYDKPNKNFTNWIKTHFGYTGSSSGAPIGSTNGVSYMEHVAFLHMWLCKFLTCSKSSQLGPANVTFWGDSLLGKSIASLPLPKHHVEDCFRFFYGCSQSRDLPYGLALNKGNHYPCGCEVYYPAAVGRQMGFIQGVPSPMVDSHNYFSSWRVSFKKASEVNSVVNFNRELVKVFNFQNGDPEFGFTESFKAWWGKMCSPSYLPTSSPLVATKEASADSSHSQGEKRPLPSTQGKPTFDRNSSSYDVEILPADDIILARLRKILRNPLPPGSSRIAEQPNPTHLTMATRSAFHSHYIFHFIRTHIFETDVGGQTATSEAEVEMEVIGANLSTNPNVIMAETQQVTQPSGSRGVDRGVIDDPSHIPDHQAPNDIFAYLDQWDASATTAKASTCHATSSTVAGVLPNPAAEALLRSYKDRDCISLADQDERDKVKAIIEALVNSGFFTDQTTMREG
ncbi:unnamed protein product [Prunus brigantina]